MAFGPSNSFLDGSVEAVLVSQGKSFVKALPRCVSSDAPAPSGRGSEAL